MSGLCSKLSICILDSRCLRNAYRHEREQIAAIGRVCWCLCSQSKLSKSQHHELEGQHFEYEDKLFVSEPATVLWWDRWCKEMRKLLHARRCRRRSLLPLHHPAILINTAISYTAIQRPQNATRHPILAQSHRKYLGEKYIGLRGRHKEGSPVRALEAITSISCSRPASRRPLS